MSSGNERAMTIETHHPSPPASNGMQMYVYSYLTGPDDATFCRRVTENLNKGWRLYGSPTLSYDPARKQMTCGQAML